MGALSEIAQSALDQVKQRQRRSEACRNRRHWTDEEIQQLRDRYADEDTASIALDINCSVEKVYSKAAQLGLHKSEAYLAECLTRCGQQRAESGRATRFQKGLVPWNKGLKGMPSIGRMEQTQFKKGSKPGNWLPIGSYRFSKDGYLQRKVTDTGYPPKDWIAVHTLLWEEHNGCVPNGHCLCFKDGNKQNIVIENLELITRAERMRRNSIHRYPPELKDAIRTVAKLKRTIKEVERHEKQG